MTFLSSLIKRTVCATDCMTLFRFPEDSKTSFLHHTKTGCAFHPVTYPKGAWVFIPLW